MNPTASEQQRQRIEDFQRTNQLGLATLFFSDLVGSTQLKQNLGDRDAIRLIQAHHTAFRELLGIFPNAEEIDTAGDSFFLVFATPSDAVRFALFAQARTNALAAESGYPLRDRIGIHVGEVFIKAAEHAGKVKDLFGIAVDSCARIMSLGEGDQILLSRFAFDSARQALRGDALEGIGELAWLNHGFYEMKGVEEPVEICEVGEIGRACLKAPEPGEKAHRVVTGDEPVLGWRPAAGQTVPNTQWVLDRLLGEGGFGEVWLARHQTLKDRRVFKFCFNAEKARSLKREVTLFRVLREHVGAQPGIVAMHDVYFDQPPYYIVMDHIDGPTLTGWAEAHAPLDSVPIETRLEIVAQIADALQTAHDAGVIHRDVKPSNILIAEEAGAPRAMLTDFGIGQLISSEALAGITQLGFTQTMMAADSMTGTQLYLAPELLSGHSATIRSDIYALGIVLYQLVAGAMNRPLTSDWADDIADPLLREDIRNCVAGDPAKRFAGGAQLAAHLRTLPQRRAEKESVERLRARTARRKKQMRLVSFAAAAVATAAVFFAFAFLRERDLKLKVAEEGRRAERALADLKQTAPTLIAEGRKLIDAQQFDDALAKISFAVTIEPKNAGDRLLRAQLLQAMLRLDEAAAEFRRVLALGPDAAAKDSAQANLTLCEKLLHDYPSADAFDRAAFQSLYERMEKEERATQAAPIAVKLGLSRNAAEALLKARLSVWRQIPGWDKRPERERVRWERDGTLFLDFNSILIDDLASLSGLPVTALWISNTRVTDLRPLLGMRLRDLRLMDTPKPIDLAPLKGMPLEYFMCEAANLGLAPLAGMKLKTIRLAGPTIRDCSPLKGMPLENVFLGTAAISDLNAFSGAPISSFTAQLCGALTDISAVRTMRLRYADFSDCPKLRDVTPLLDCPTLETVRVPRDCKEIEVLRKYPGLRQLSYAVGQGKPTAEFWAEFDAIWKAKADDAVMRGKVRAACEAAGLPANTDPDKMHRMEDGTYSCGLAVFGGKEKRLPDLRDLPISDMNLDQGGLTDISLLAGLPLRKLNLRTNRVRDLTPLAHCVQLEELNLTTNPDVRDLSPLAGLKLRELRLPGTNIADISVLSGMPLRVLDCSGTKVTNLRPLLSCPELENLTIPDTATNIGELRALKKLKRIAYKWDHNLDAPAQSAEEFWKEYDAQQAAGKK